MAEYKVKSTQFVHFEIKREDVSVGQLHYKNWFSLNAKADIPGKGHFSIEQKGFWGTSIELKHEEQVLLQFKMNWSGDIIFQCPDKTQEKSYILKHKGFFKESFVLLSANGEELLILKPHLVWSKMSYEFSIASNDLFEQKSDKELLLISAVHCANYYISTISSVGG